MGAVLQIQHVEKRFGKLIALNDVSLSVQRGQIHGVIGPNGSGKSTLLKCIAGAEVATSGRIVFEERDITQLPADQRARAGLCLTFQVTSILPLLSVYDNVLLAVQRGTSLGRLLMSRSRTRLRENVIGLLKAINLEDRAQTPAEELSHGQQQWLEMAMALGQQPSSGFREAYVQCHYRSGSGGSARPRHR
jgi:branched-chain amino acid transport system ATP-binding protein